MKQKQDNMSNFSINANGMNTISSPEKNTNHYSLIYLFAAAGVIALFYGLQHFFKISNSESLDINNSLDNHSSNNEASVTPQLEVSRSENNSDEQVIFHGALESHQDPVEIISSEIYDVIEIPLFSNTINTINKDEISTNRIVPSDVKITASENSAFSKYESKLNLTPITTLDTSTLNLDKSTNWTPSNQLGTYEKELEMFNDVHTIRNFLLIASGNSIQSPETFSSTQEKLEEQAENFEQVKNMMFSGEINQEIVSSVDILSHMEQNNTDDINSIQPETHI